MGLLIHLDDLISVKKQIVVVHLTVLGQFEKHLRNIKYGSSPKSTNKLLEGEKTKQDIVVNKAKKMPVFNSTLSL